MYSKYAAQLIPDFVTASLFGNYARKTVPQNILDRAPEGKRTKGRPEEREMDDVRRCTTNYGFSRRRY
jgi:hypothetical protein